jgi:DnaK suppressor protein
MFFIPLFLLFLLTSDGFFITLLIFILYSLLTGGKKVDEKRQEHYKFLLNEQLKELMEEAAKTVNDLTVTDGEFPDPTDRASWESDRNFLLRIRERERKLITKIAEALERIEEGTFGICERCGEPISEKRLEARPVTTLCINCKQEQEDLEKRGIQ